MRLRRLIQLICKGFAALRRFGLRGTWARVRVKLHHMGDLSRLARQALFSEEELRAQRAHRFAAPVTFSLVVPLYNTPARFLREMLESVQAQTYGNWELCLADGSDTRYTEAERICREAAERDARIRYVRLEKNRGISGNTNAALEMAAGEYIGLLDHDDLLHPAALFELMRAIERTGADFLYTDEAVFQSPRVKALLSLHFKPTFSPDLLRGNNYICHFTAFKRSLLEEVGLFDPACDGSQDHDMVLRLTEKAARVAHIPEVLYYWRSHKSSAAGNDKAKPYAVQAGVRSVEKQLQRLGLDGTVEPLAPGQTLYRVRYAIEGTPKVSILIPTCEHLDDLRACLDSIFRKTTWPNYEIVLVEGNSRSPEVFAFYGRLQREHDNVRVVTRGGAFNYSAANNFGARFCTGEYLLLLNNDTQIISPDWIQEMLMFAQRPDVGAVGALLCYPDDTIQHAGVIVGIGAVAGHSHKGFGREGYGYMNRLAVAQNFSAVTAACLLIPRRVWDEVGGLDEGYAIAFNDVDLCLRIRAAGRLIVWTPYAALYHFESKSRGYEDTPEKRARYAGEVRRFQTRWKDFLAAGDPYYNPNLTLEGEDFSFKPSLGQYEAR